MLEVLSKNCLHTLRRTLFTSPANFITIWSLWVCFPDPEWFGGLMGPPWWIPIWHTALSFYHQPTKELDLPGKNWEDVVNPNFKSCDLVGICYCYPAWWQYSKQYVWLGNGGTEKLQICGWKWNLLQKRIHSHLEKDSYSLLHEHICTNGTPDSIIFHWVLDPCG